MGKRYKEFLIDVIVKAFQIIFAVGIVTPLFTKSIEPFKIIMATLVVVLLLLWGGAISAKMEVQHGCSNCNLVNLVHNYHITYCFLDVCFSEASGF